MKMKKNQLRVCRHSRASGNPGGWTPAFAGVTMALVAWVFLGSRAWAEPEEKSVNPAASAQTGALPEEVVIKGQDIGAKIGAAKPPLNISMDRYETIRASLAPDRSLFLAQSRFITGWRHTHPEVLFNPRVIEAWRGIFGSRSGIAFNLVEQLQDVLPVPIGEDAVRKFQWSLTIADEEGRIFQQYEGKKDPPAELLWNGQNAQGKWIQPGHTYSPVYKFVDPTGSPYTRVGKPIQVSSLARPELNGLVIGLDSEVLFGSEKAFSSPEKAGQSLLRDAADYIKRNYTDVSILIRIFAATKDLADSQGESVQTFLARELMMAPQGLTVQTDSAPYSDQRTEIILLNR